MKKADQTQLINTILDGLKAELLTKVEKMPEAWNGFEIKQLILDHYKMNYYDASKLTGSRKKDYTNFCLNNNLF